MDDRDSNGFESGNAVISSIKEIVAVGIDPPSLCR